ncbi:MAG TPA: cytochrome c oxidase assembly protein [Blastocatellia bacterium]|nr:cytochrome c oxidase assembly protein [Blastocatellia bacterium]
MTTRGSRFRLTFAIVATIVIALPATVLAHSGEPLEPHDVWTAWSFEPGIVISLMLSAVLYVKGAFPLLRNISTIKSKARFEALCFAGGWLALVIALVSPVHPMGEVLFSAHMTQHEILMLVAAPLLVLGRPMLPFLWALPMQWRRRAGKISRLPLVQKPWHFLTGPVVAGVIHGVTLWVWHIPALFDATLTSDLVHTTQHLSFLITALFFWWALIHGRDGRIGYGAAVLYLFITAVHTSVLGALMTFAPTVWYPVYGNSPVAWGLTPLEDQQLGGLIMWVPAGLIYVVAGLAMFAAWIRESERRALRREASAVPGSLWSKNGL